MKTFASSNHLFPSPILSSSIFCGVLFSSSFFHNASRILLHSFLNLKSQIKLYAISLNFVSSRRSCCILQIPHNCLTIFEMPISWMESMVLEYLDWSIQHKTIPGSSSLSGASWSLYPMSMAVWIPLDCKQLNESSVLSLYLPMSLYACLNKFKSNLHILTLE